MSNVVLPTIIQGRCWLVHNGATIHFQNGISIDEQVETFNPETDLGLMGERFKSRKFLISGDPIGALTSGNMDYFYSAFLTPTAVGRTLIPSDSTAKKIVIHSESEGKTYTFVRGALTQPPGLTLSPGAQAFAGAQWMAIGDVSVQPTNAAFYKTIASASVTDGTYDSSKIITDVYKGALSGGSAPLDAIGSMDGFKIGFTLGTKEILCGDVGVADLVCTGVGLNVNFAPSNLAESDYDTLIKLQNTGALVPGQPFGAVDFTITGTQSGWVFVCKTTGFKRGTRTYKVGDHRFNDVEGVNKRTFGTPGTPDPLLAYTAPS